MKITQLKDLVNQITKETLGKEDIATEDLSNVVDIGKEIFDNTSVDNYVKSLVNRIGKTVFAYRKYSGNVPAVLMDSWEFGSVLQKITADIPEAEENQSWNLSNKQTYDTNVFYKPSVSVKFFNKKTTFDIPMSFTEKQVKESFNSAEELNGFVSMLYDSVEKSMTIKVDSLIMRTINNMTAQTFNTVFKGNQKSYAQSSDVKAINLLYEYNNRVGGQLTVATALKDKDFLKFASMQISLYKNRFSKISTCFNIGGKEKFTDNENLRIVLLSEFSESVKTYLESDTFNADLVKLPNCDTVPYWQGSGSNYSFDDTSKIDVKVEDLKDSSKTVDISVSGILGVMFDKDALGVTNIENRVTTAYNARAEFFTNWYKFECGYFNDLNENFVIFFIA